MKATQAKETDIKKEIVLGDYALAIESREAS
ncbi:MAG: hypothetical protein ACI9RP_001996, partial [Cyclobacteriaceae bacterium]